MKIFSFVLIATLFIVLIGIRNYEKLAPKIFSRLAVVIFILSFCIFSVFPEYLQSIAKIFGIGRGADLLIYLCCIGIIGLAGLTIVKIRMLEHKIALLVRYLSIHDDKLRGED